MTLTAGAPDSGRLVSAHCVFCERIDSGDFDYEDGCNVAFQPLNPVTPGHFLVVPRKHVSNALASPSVAGRALQFAGYLANRMNLGAANFITSAGRDATQTVFHLHIHVVPRSAGDGLMLPWTGQEKNPVNLQDILKPGDVLAVRGDGLAAELIRVGEELSGKPGLDNHIAVMHHWTGNVPWGLEGKPGGVGWADLRTYIRDPYTLNNCAQPGRDRAVRAQVAMEAQHMLGTPYDWQAITDDTLRAFRMDDLFSKTINGTVPGHVVCSSYAAFLYQLYGWDCPQVPDRDCEPADWTALITERDWNVKLEA